MVTMGATRYYQNIYLFDIMMVYGKEETSRMPYLEKAQHQVGIKPTSSGL